MTHVSVRIFNGGFTSGLANREARRLTEVGFKVIRVDNTDAVKLLHPDAGPDIGAGHASALPGIALLSTPGRPLERVRAPWIGSYAEYACAAPR